MGYQALLFCLDEKLARVVTQVFSELDFKVEPVNEPFAAVKKLMAQRYDAIVVDCENEPNATLLFKSARNSSSNQSSLALALVEGQSGVAKAYRIGANLVLTKPINVEQAKGTLRVARGLLRKNLDAATSSSAAPAKVAPADSPFKPVSPSVGTIPAGSIYEPSVFESALPAMAASTKVDDSPIAAPASDGRTKVLAEANSSATTAFHAPVSEPAKPAAPSPFKSSVSTPASTSGAASAAAPAKEASPAPAEKKAIIAPAAAQEEVSFPNFGATIPGSSPSFAALEDEDSDDPGGTKKILIAAAVVLLVVTLAYFGWSKGKASSVSQQPITTASHTPAAESAVAPSVPTTEQRSSISQPIAPQNSKPSANISNSPAITIDADTEPVPKKAGPAAIVVKSYSAGKKTQAQGEESAPQIPSPLAVATPNDKNLSGLVASVPTALPKATLATLKISQGLSQGLLIKRVQPRYPQNALAMRVQGAVELQATINKEGNISNLKVVKGDAVLARAATEAVRQWRYKPYYLNGEPVDIETQITVNFKLPN